MNDRDLLRKLYEEADYVHILTGAGMSAPLGTPTYWSGPNAAYASDVSVHGLTALQHIQMTTWDQHEAEQLAYFRDLYKGFVEKAKWTDTHYHKLADKLHSDGKEYFNVTSNIDNAFINYGFREENLYEVHGSTRHSQCLMFPDYHSYFPTTDPEVGHAVCPCGSAARPNALFFDDWAYNTTYEEEQYLRYQKFRAKPGKHLVLEVGAGVNISTIRQLAVRFAVHSEHPLVRVNPNPNPEPSGMYDRWERTILENHRKEFLTFTEEADKLTEFLS